MKALSLRRHDTITIKLLNNFNGIKIVKPFFVFLTEQIFHSNMFQVISNLKHKLKFIKRY